MLSESQESVGILSMLNKYVDSNNLDVEENKQKHDTVGEKNASSMSVNI